MTIFELKLFAVLFMVIDHIAMYFGNMPPLHTAAHFMRMIGRLSFPLFLFCMAQGYRHTRSRKRYLLRLYLMSLVMTGIMYCSGDSYGNHNIFLTMFWVGVLISLIELLQSDFRKGCIACCLFAAAQSAVIQLDGLLFPTLNGDITCGLLLNPHHCEYGLPYVILGVLMYFLWERRNEFCAMYIVFALLEFCNADVQFLIIFALPLMLRYNGERGRSMKWFFYLFYPAHTLLLYWLSTILAG